MDDLPEVLPGKGVLPWHCRWSWYINVYLGAGLLGVKVSYKKHHLAAECTACVIWSFGLMVSRQPSEPTSSP